MNAARRSKLWSAAIVLGCISATQVQAAVYDFEGGTLQGWLATTTGGSGSTGVGLHNGSNAAFVSHTGSGTHALSLDVPYVADATLSFDMHAIANTATTSVGGVVAHSRSGVTVSFLNSFNVSLGAMGLFNVTSTSLLPANSFSVDTNQHNYSNTMATFAGAAGLGSASPIAKISISFNAVGQTGCAGVVCNANSTATVWFDNLSVSVTPVPEPATYALLLAGLGITLLAARRRSNGRNRGQTTMARP